MNYLFNFFILTIFLSSILPTFSKIILECKFSKPFLLPYYCKVQDNGIFDGTQISIDETQGSHSIFRDNNDVKEILIVRIKNVNFVPKNIGKHFENIQRVDIKESNLAEIHQSDLKQFPNLESLHLQNNNLQVIEENLFEFNTKLKVIDLSNNNIEKIDPNAFSKLDSLWILNFSENPCNSQFAISRMSVEKVIEKIINQQCDINDKFSSLLDFTLIFLIIFVIIIIISVIVKFFIVVIKFIIDSFDETEEYEAV